MIKNDNNEAGREKMITIEAGTTLTARSVCDSDCVFTAKIISRTAKMATVETMDGVKRCKIKVWHDGSKEYIQPFGNYSMSVIFSANEKAVA